MILAKVWREVFREEREGQRTELGWSRKKRTWSVLNSHWRKPKAAALCLVCSSTE